MTEHYDGGPAFGHGSPEHGGHPGMSLRDWFAGQALAGIAGPHGEGFSLQESDAANWAYEYADAMLKARQS